MRNSPVFVLSVIIFLAVLGDAKLIAQSLTFPTTLASGKPGLYDVSVQYSKFDVAPGVVRMMVYIPQSLQDAALSERPAIIFFHGNSQDKNYYRNSVAYMTQRAEKFRFVLISVQNWWMLSGGNVDGADDSRRAVNLLMHRMVDEDLCNRDKVYPTGFSAGGFNAVLTFFNSIDEFRDKEFAATYLQIAHESGLEISDPAAHYYEGGGGVAFNTFPYAGFASFKGNYYESFFQMNPMVEDGQPHFKKLLKGKVLFIAVGSNDVPRVKEQAPQAAEFFRMYTDTEPTFKIYQGEGHVLSDANWSDFWALVE